MCIAMIADKETGSVELVNAEGILDQMNHLREVFEEIASEVNLSEDLCDKVIQIGGVLLPMIRNEIEAGQFEVTPKQAFQIQNLKQEVNDLLARLIVAGNTANRL